MATIRNLNIFLTVYKTLNITRAAEELYLTQPAVSRAIIDLETEYDVRLFERYHKRLIPTEAAERLYAYGMQITGTFDELDRFMRDAGRTGSIRVGSTITIGKEILPDLIRKFSEGHESVLMKMTVANGAALKQKLLDNTLDIALIEDSVSEEDLAAEPFMHDELLLIVPKGHELLRKEKIRLKDVIQYPLLLREKGSTSREYLDHVLSVNNVTVEPMMESVSNSAIIRAVETNLGVSVLPAALVKQPENEGRIVTARISGLPMERTYYIVHHKQKYLSPALSDFIAFCLKEGKQSRE